MMRGGSQQLLDAGGVYWLEACCLDGFPELEGGGCSHTHRWVGWAAAEMKKKNEKKTLMVKWSSV